MTDYVDNFADRAEEIHRKLPADATLHLARSCFAAILQDTYSEARSSGVDHDSFRARIGTVIDQLDLPIFSAVDDAVKLPNKRQPSLRESFDATLDRYAAIDELKSVLGGTASSMVYGGSMKYGPFLNVRSGTDSSDIDAIVFTDGELLDALDWRGVMETDLFDERDKITFFARLSLQRALIEDGLADITSQRFTIVDQGYTLSTHFIPTSFVADAYPQRVDEITTKHIHHKYVRDYKERPFERTHVSNHDMSSALHDIPVYNTATNGGFIAANPAYSVIRGRYVPGMYQNLVLPNAHYIFGAHSSAAEQLNTFATAVARQEEKEKQIDPDASVLNTEPRKPIIGLDVSGILSP